MNTLELLVGRKIKVKTDVGTDAILEIKKVERNHHSEDLEPSTRENDWWPASREWDTYSVHFTNGHRKTYDSLESIDII